MKTQLSLSETVPLKVNDDKNVDQETYVSKASLKNVSFARIEAASLPIPLRHALFHIADVNSVGRLYVRPGYNAN